MIKSEQKAIGDRGYLYTVRQFGAREGGRILIRLGKLLGKPVGDALSAGKSLDLETGGHIISGLADRITEEDYDSLAMAFAKHTEVTGGEYGAKSIQLSSEGVFDLHFAGAYAELGLWLVFALEVNYSSFFGGVGSGKLTNLVASLQVSQQEQAEASP